MKVLYNGVVVEAVLIDRVIPIADGSHDTRLQWAVPGGMADERFPADWLEHNHAEAGAWLISARNGSRFIMSASEFTLQCTPQSVPGIMAPGEATAGRVDTTAAPTEGELQARAVAPRVEAADITAAIKDTAYYVFPGSMLTVCCLTLQNGYTVTGESACAAPQNFQKDIGERFAFENAKRKVWPLLGFMLRERLHVSNPASMPVDAESRN